MKITSHNGQTIDHGPVVRHAHADGSLNSPLAEPTPREYSDPTFDVVSNYLESLEAWTLLRSSFVNV